MADDFDLRARLGLDQTAYEAGLKKAREQTQQFATVVDSTITRTTTQFGSKLKNSVGQAAFAFQDFAAVMGQGGSNAFGRAIMSASNNIGMLGASFGPWGMAAATGAAVLGSTLIPALLEASSGTKKLTEDISRFLERSGQIGKNVDFAVGLERQFQRIQRGGGAFGDFTRDLQEQTEDIGRAMNKLKVEFAGTDVLADVSKKIRDQMANIHTIEAQHAERAGPFGRIDMDAVKRDFEIAKQAARDFDLFRLSDKDLSDRAKAVGIDQAQIDKLLEIRKHWTELQDQMTAVENMRKKIAEGADGPVVPQGVAPHLRGSMEALMAEAAFLNANWQPPGVPKLAPAVAGAGPIDEMARNAKRQQDVFRRQAEAQARAARDFPVGPDFEQRVPRLPRRGEEDFERRNEEALRAAKENNILMQNNNQLLEQLVQERRREPQRPNVVIKNIDHF